MFVLAYLNYHHITSLSTPHRIYTTRTPRLSHTNHSLLLHNITGQLELEGYYGLNWKSLSQPAILPSSTDFLVPLSELKDEGEKGVGRRFEECRMR